MTLDMQLWQVMMMTAIAAMVGIFIGLAWGTTRYKKKIQVLNGYLDQMMRGIFPENFDAYKEGDFGILYDQLEKVMNRTHFLVSRLEREKNDIKDFIGDISHELKTPMTALVVYLDVLLYQTADKAAKEQLERCIMLADKMSTIIKSLLDLARLETDDLILKTAPCVISDTVDYAYNLVMQCGINNYFKLDNQVGLGIVMKLDEQWITQALFNIMKNAASYCGEMPCVTVTSMQTDTVVILKIKDNGSGMTADEALHIFDRFYRAKENKVGGLGLGLAISKMIVEKHHGQIEVRSDSTGTEFIIKIPLLDMIAKEKV